MRADRQLTQLTLIFRRWAIDSLADQTFFSQHTEGLKQDDLDTLSALSVRWRKHIQAGRFKLSVPLDTPIGHKTEIGGFWTTQYPYQLIPEKDPKLLEELRKSNLVILKGDLNYRKCARFGLRTNTWSLADQNCRNENRLVADGKWAPTTSFDTALGPLAGQVNLLSLRTNKADPM